MPNITYSLGEISFDAVPRKGARAIDIGAKARVTLARKTLHTLIPPAERVSLAGRYLAESTRASLESLITATESSGTIHIFDNGETQYRAVIERFTCEAIVGVAESAYSFEIDLLLLGEVEE
jgi:hypothetical protein